MTSNTPAPGKLGFVSVAFLVMALFVLIGYLVFQKYRLGDTPDETRRTMNLPEAKHE